MQFGHGAPLVLSEPRLARADRTKLAEELAQAHAVDVAPGVENGSPGTFGECRREASQLGRVGVVEANLTAAGLGAVFRRARVTITAGKNAYPDGRRLVVFTLAISTAAVTVAVAVAVDVATATAAAAAAATAVTTTAASSDIAVVASVARRRQIDNRGPVDDHRINIEGLNSVFALATHPGIVFIPGATRRRRHRNRSPNVHLLAGSCNALEYVRQTGARREPVIESRGRDARHDLGLNRVVIGANRVFEVNGRDIKRGLFTSNGKDGARFFQPRLAFHDSLLARSCLRFHRRKRRHGAPPFQCNQGIRNIVARGVAGALLGRF